MKIVLDHKKANIMESLGCSRDRMDEIVESARKVMMKDNPTGTKTQQLESMVDQCETVEEAIAATMVWVSMTSQMDNREVYNKAVDKAQTNAFKDKVMSANPDMKIIR